MNKEKILLIILLILQIVNIFTEIKLIDSIVKVGIVLFIFYLVNKKQK